MEQYLNVCSISGKILVRGIDSEGQRYRQEVQYAPYAFLESPEETQYKSIAGHSLKRYQTDSTKDFWEFKKRCSEVDINVYGMDNVITQYITDNFKTEFDVDKIRIFYLDIENRMIDSSGKRFGIDPEGAHGEITAITIYNTLDKEYHVFGVDDWKNTLYSHLDITYHHCEDEFALLSLFMKYWIFNYPDIISGWGSDNYDFPYLINRIEKVISKATAKKLSPWGKITKRDYINDIGKKSVEYKIFGISAVDYLPLYKKNKFQGQESYKLDWIAEVEVGKGKLDFRDEGYIDLEDLYIRNPQMYIDYNIRDVESLVEIDKKNKFMTIVIGVGHYAMVNYDEVNSAIKCWDSIRHRYMYDHGMVTSPKTKNVKKDKFMGAYVKTPKPGKYKWVITFDLSSLYPSIIKTGNIGDEMLVEERNIPPALKSLYNRTLVDEILNYRITDEQHQALVDNNLTMTGNGMFYRNTEKSINTHLYDVVLGERRDAKNTMLKYKDEVERAKESGKDISDLEDKVAYYNNQQMILKVLANSLYGILGNQYYRYFDVRLAESVTYTGQTIIKWSEMKINQYLNQVLGTDDYDFVIAIDTDSIMVDFEPLVNKMDIKDLDDTIAFLDKVGDQVNVKLAEFYDELGTILNSTNNSMSMKREIIADTAIFKAKKMYAMSVWNSEGVAYDEPEYKIMGLEIVRSTTPKFVRDKLKHALIMMLSDCTQDELMDYVEEVKIEYMKQTDLANIAFPSGCNGVSDYTVPRTIYKKGSPAHIRGAVLFNHYYADDYNKIEDGDKVRYVYLKVPNPMNENVISVKDDKVPDELDKFIDWEMNFEKVFTNPVKSLAKVLGWGMTNTFSLADLL